MNHGGFRSLQGGSREQRTSKGVDAQSRQFNALSAKEKRAAANISSVISVQVRPSKVTFALALAVCQVVAAPRGAAQKLTLKPPPNPPWVVHRVS
jgi:hypothetical protein